jgi:hypothetical protein
VRRVRYVVISRRLFYVVVMEVLIRMVVPLVETLDAHPLQAEEIKHHRHSEPRGESIAEGSGEDEYVGG